MVKSSDDWKSESVNKTFSSAASWAASGASLGASLFGGLGGLVGGVLGFGIGGIISSTIGNKYQVNSYIKNAATERKAATIERNKGILSAQTFINSTKSSFNTTYGSGMFEQYDTIFMDLLGRPASDSLSTILSNMQMDKVSGVINSRIEGKADKETLVSMLSLENINAEYLEYLKEQIRAQDTTFGLAIKTESELERQSFYQYYKDVNSIQLQYAQQFQTAFLNNRQENISGESALGQASLEQASSGLRQDGSGTSLTMMQKFQNDLSKVAQASVLKYQLQMMGMDIESGQNNLLILNYQRRQQIKIDTKTQLENLVSAYNKYHEQAGNFYIGISDYENVINEWNKGISEAEKGRDGWFNKTDWNNLEHTEEMESYFG